MAERPSDAEHGNGNYLQSVFKTRAALGLGSMLVQGTCEYHHSLVRKRSFVVDQAAPIEPLDDLRILVSQTAATEKSNQQALF
jgi:hypothetical protein